MITVVEAGWGSTVQDLGRPGYAHLGVSPSGMVDTALGTLVNRLVGNPGGAPLIETCGAIVLRAERALLLATSVEAAPFTLAAGETYRMPTAPERLWHYVAVRGGLAVEPVLGSASTDTMAGLGPAALAGGDSIAVGPDPRTELALDVAALAPPPAIARCTAGPRADWFEPGWERALDRAPLTVRDVSRVGVRLTGVELRRRRGGELPSEGLVRGAIQAPPGGELLMMLADHPTTGGYPVVAVVHSDDVAGVAQHRPGGLVRLRVL
jgi:biotin-dependent carboxylase-like uncharacterized protein